MERSLRGVTRVAWAQYEATAPEIPQLSNPSMEPELAIVVVETGKAPGARVGARNLRIRVIRIGSQHVDSEPQERDIALRLLPDGTFPNAFDGDLLPCPCCVGVRR